MLFEFYDIYNLVLIQNKYKQVIVICRGTDVLLLLYHIGCTKYEVWIMSGALKQKRGYPVYIILSKQDTY